MQGCGAPRSVQISEHLNRLCLPYIAPLSPLYLTTERGDLSLYLRYVSPISPLYLRYISPRSVEILARRITPKASPTKETKTKRTWLGLGIGLGLGLGLGIGLGIG